MAGDATTCAREHAVPPRADPPARTAVVAILADGPQVPIASAKVAADAVVPADVRRTKGHSMGGHRGPVQ